MYLNIRKVAPQTLPLPFVRLANGVVGEEEVSVISCARSLREVKSVGTNTLFTAVIVRENGGHIANSLSGVVSTMCLSTDNVPLSCK